MHGHSTGANSAAPSPAVCWADLQVAPMEPVCPCLSSFSLASAGGQIGAPAQPPTVSVSPAGTAASEELVFVLGNPARVCSTAGITPKTHSPSPRVLIGFREETAGLGQRGPARPVQLREHCGQRSCPRSGAAETRPAEFPLRVTRPDEASVWTVLEQGKGWGAQPAPVPRRSLHPAGHPPLKAGLRVLLPLERGPGFTAGPPRPPAPAGGAQRDPGAPPTSPSRPGTCAGQYAARHAPSAFRAEAARHAPARFPARSMAAPAPRRSQAGPRVRPLAALGCPLGGLAPGRARVLGAGARVFASTGGRFVHVYDREGQRLSAALEFPAPVRHLQLLPGPAALLVLGARSGLYRVSLEPASRSPGYDVAGGDGVDCEPPLRRTPVGPDACILPDPSLCAFAVCGELLVTLALGSTGWKVRRTLCPAPGEEVPPAPIGEVDLPVKVPPAGSPTQPPAPQHLPVLCHVAPTGLDPTLPGLLFGTDACILRSPLLLCGLPSGQLCVVLLDALATSHGTPGDPHALVRTIHHLQEPVVFVGALSTGPPAEGLVDMPSNCLVALGCRGRLLTVRAGRDEAGSPVLELREHQVPGPVLCAACDRGHCLFLSTPSGLCVVGLSEQGDICPISTGLCRLAALAVSTIAPGESPELLALSARGRLLACDLGLISQSVPKGGTQHIPDLLAQITTTSEKVASLQNQAEQQNQALRSLNEALAVTRALLRDQKGLGPVSCCIYAAWTCLSSGDMLLACCKLRVQPGFNLGQGWALCVRLLPVTRADTDTPDTATTFTVPLGLLGPGAQRFVTLPLNCAEAGAPKLPVLVSCRLFYSLWDSVRDVLDPRALPQHEGASLPLAWMELDLLHALRFPNTPDPTPCGVPRDPIDIFLEAQCRSGSEQRVPLLPPTPTAVVVTVSVQLLRAALARHHSDLPLGPATLRWLLSGNLDAEKAPALPRLHGVAPDGTDVHLSVREVCVSDASPDGPLQAVEIQVESPALGVLSAAHRAITRRVQALTLEPTSSHAPDFCLHHLQVLQASREALLREIRALREQLRLGEEEAPHVARHLLHTFQNLRASGPPLL